MPRPKVATPRKILVTGGGGFVGAAVAEALSGAGHDVVAVDVKLRGFARGVPLVRLDVTDASALSAACKGVDSVVHCASLVHTRGTGGRQVWAVNHGGTLNVLDACARHGVSRLVHLSSASVVYDGRDLEDGDESLPYAGVPQMPYAESKIAAEKAVLDFGGRAGTRVCALRPHLVFGPGDGRLVPNILKRASSRLGVREIGRRDRLSDFTFISNLVDAVLAAEARLVPGSAVCGEAFFVTNGEPKPFFEFVEELIVALGHPPPRGRTPYWLAYGGAALLETLRAVGSGPLRGEDGVSRAAVQYLATHHYFSIRKARETLGWTPRVALAEGLGRTVDHLRGLERRSPERRAAPPHREKRP